MLVDVQQHAANLRSKGFTVVAQPVFADQAVLTEAADECSARLKSNLDEVRKLGLDPRKQGWSFNEICHRSPCRYDFRYLQSPAIEHITDAALKTVEPILFELHKLPVHPEERGGMLLRQLWPRRLSPRRPEALMTGSIVSRPGAPIQLFHRDAEATSLVRSSLLPSHRLFNCFVPLVNIDEGTTGTEFWPGSHHMRAWRQWVDAPDDVVRTRLFQRATTEAPACPAGGVILLDFRTMHRGLPNTGTGDRPYLYTVCGTGWARDTYNFPAHSLSSAVERLPADKSELNTVRRVLSKSLPWVRDGVFPESP